VRGVLGNRHSYRDKNSLDYRFYDFIENFKKRSWELQQFSLKIWPMAHDKAVYIPAGGSF
jgi:hypothetical protein